MKSANSLRKAGDPTIFIVDDDTEVRRTIALLVRSVGFHDEQFASAAEFLGHADDYTIGCLILDNRMPGMTGLELLRQLRSADRLLPVIFISGHHQIEVVASAMRGGALDFIAKPIRPQVLLERINEAVAICRERHRKLATQSHVKCRIAKLTNRERQVMDCLAMGQSTKVIASRMGISRKTVDNHRAKVLEKMDVDNAAQLIRAIS